MQDPNESRPFVDRLRESSRLGWLAIRLAWRASPRLLLGVLALAALQAVVPSVQLILSRAVLDRIALDVGLIALAPPWVSTFDLTTWIVLGAAILAFGKLIQPFAATFHTLVGDRLTGFVAEQLIRAANRWQGLARFEDPSLADDLERARRTASWGGHHVVISGSDAVLPLLTAGSLAVVLVGLHPVVPFLLVLAALPQMARQWEYGHRTFSHLYAQTPDARRLRYSREVLLFADPAKDVRLYGLGPFFRQRYDEIFDRTAGTLDLLRRRLSLQVALASALSATVMGGVYLYVVWLILQRQLTIGDLALFGGAAAMLHANLLSLGFSIGSFPLTFEFLPSLFRILEAPPDLPIARNPRPAPRPIREGIVFERVGFLYPGQSTPALRDISFCIRPGESVALVGRNGAGKTTIVKLLLRLYDPTSGRILVDGVDLREYDLDDLRREMGVIFQDFTCYELTAGENVGLGRVEAMGDRQRLLDAVAKTGATDLVDRLPDGLDTLVGREFGGRELSGGEWQKLALARAFLRDAQLLALDEPTASLDVQTEYDVYLRFRQLTAGRMTLLISHRFSTVRMADRILYLADGRIQEEGSHADLMARGGEYAHLYQLQAAQYLEPESIGEDR